MLKKKGYIRFILFKYELKKHHQLNTFLHQILKKNMKFYYILSEF
jgi:hypothetical protein